MAKKICIDEAHILHEYKYKRMIVAYQCGCSYYNDLWQSPEQPDAHCPKHHKAIKAITGEYAFGNRPNKAETKRHTLKMN